MGDVIPSVKALIADGGRVLALEMEADGERFWSLPGGRVEHGEAPLDALRREVHEEVGLDADPREPVGMYHFFWDGKQVVLTVYRCGATGDVTMEHQDEDEPIVGYEWVEPRALVERTMEDSLESLIRDVYGL